MQWLYFKIISIFTPALDTTQNARKYPGGVTDSLRKIIVVSTILITLGVTSIVSIHYLGLFRRISVQQREDMIGRQKDFIRDLIAIEFDYITRAKAQFEQEISSGLLNDVNNACQVAETLYDRYHGKMAEAEIREMIIAAISSMRGSGPYARVFINRLDGFGVYYPDNPDRQGVDLTDSCDTQGNYVVRNELELLSKNKGGFIRYRIQQEPGARTMGGKKVAYVRKFEHFNWYFGAKCYIDDYYNEFKEEIARKISSERFGYGGYFFLDEANGRPVVKDGQLHVGDFNYLDGSDTAKMNVFKRQLEIARATPEGGFLDYMWNKMGEKEPSQKIAYLRYFPECKWIIGAGFYVDEIDTELLIQAKDLKAGIIERLIQFFVILLIVIGIEVLFIFRFSKNYQADFSHFADFFERGKETYEKVDIEQLHFNEFKRMGVVANEMTEERVRIHQELVYQEKKAQEADKLKTAFLANMSHEIRTPMNAIIGFSQLIDDETIPAEERKIFRQLILQNGELLMNLINDIIDIAKIESGQLTIVKRSFNLENLLESVNIYYQEYIAGSGKPAVAFHMESDLPAGFRCYSDEFRLKQVLNNLIGNAIKFTSEGYIRLSVTISGNKVYFVITDTGIGISEEDQAQIFNRFMQAKDNLLKNYGGTGLGLTISKSIVEQMGGRIGVCSAPGYGSEFYFYIPCGETDS